MGVSENRGTPESSILIGFSILNPSILGYPLFLETPMSRETCWPLQSTEVYHESSETSAEPGGLDVGTLRCVARNSCPVSFGP